MKKDIIVEIRKRIDEFLHPSVESIIKKFGIVEDLSITEEEAAELLKMLDEWEAHDS